MSTSRRNTKAALAQLFPTAPGQREAPGLLLIERSRLTTSPQVRTDLEGGIEELRQNIASLRERRLGIEGTGILQPLLASPDPEREGHFRLIAGERRLLASQGISDELPVVIVPHDGAAAPILQLIENLQRRGLAPLEEARGLRALIEEQSLTIRDAARLLGKPKSYLTDRLALLRMRPEVQDMISQRSDTLIHAREIESVSNNALRQSLIQAVTHEQISLAELRRRIAALPHKGLPRSPADAPDPNQEHLLLTSAGELESAADEASEGRTGIERRGSRAGSRDNNPSLTSELKMAVSCLARAELMLTNAALPPTRKAKTQRQIERLEARTARLREIFDGI